MDSLEKEELRGLLELQDLEENLECLVLMVPQAQLVVRVKKATLGLLGWWDYPDLVDL